MKFCVMTAASEEFQPLAKITEPGKESYAASHGYSFLRMNHLTPHRIAWERVEFWKWELKNCDWMFFTGCDAMITNPNVQLESFIDDNKSDFIFSIDLNGLQSDSWLMRNCESTRAFLDKVAQFEGEIPNEQHAMALVLSGEKILSNYLASMPPANARFGRSAPPELLALLLKVLNKSKVRCKIVKQRQLNAYPEKLYGGTGREAWGWRAGDFVCHLPGKSLGERIEFFSNLGGGTMGVAALGGLKPEL